MEQIEHHPGVIDVATLAVTAGRSKAPARVGQAEQPDDDSPASLMAQGRGFSDATAERIDNEVKALVESIERDCRTLMEDNRDRLERLAKRLLEAETMSREQIDVVLEQPAG